MSLVPVSLSSRQGLSFFTCVPYMASSRTFPEPSHLGVEWSIIPWVYSMLHWLGVGVRRVVQCSPDGLIGLSCGWSQAVVVRWASQRSLGHHTPGSGSLNCRVLSSPNSTLSPDFKFRIPSRSSACNKCLTVIPYSQPSC